MSNLASILAPTNNHFPPPDKSTREPANQNGGHRDFDDVMSQAMAPQAASQNNATNSRLRSAVQIQSPLRPDAEDGSEAEDTGVTSNAAKTAANDSSSSTHKTETMGRDAKKDNLTQTAATGMVPRTSSFNF